MRFRRRTATITAATAATLLAISLTGCAAMDNVPTKDHPCPSSMEVVGAPVGTLERPDGLKVIVTPGSPNGIIDNISIDVTVPKGLEVRRVVTFTNAGSVDAISPDPVGGAAHLTMRAPTLLLEQYTGVAVCVVKMPA